MKVALIAIAKNEDHYIDEWIKYHLLIGIDHVFVYQNDWRYASKHNLFNNKVSWLIADGECQQLKVYNKWIQEFYQHYDFVAVLDIDEFINIGNFSSIKDILCNLRQYPAIALNWRYFGDSHLKQPTTNYSLINRFTWCQKSLNQHVKQIINLQIVKNTAIFICPHCTQYKSITVDQKYLFSGPYQPRTENDLSNGIYINHYYSKTEYEWINFKIPKGFADHPYNSPTQHEYENMQIFKNTNVNDVEDSSLRSKYNELFQKEKTNEN